MKNENKKIIYYEWTPAGMQKNHNGIWVHRRLLHDQAIQVLKLNSELNKYKIKYGELKDD